MKPISKELLDAGKRASDIVNLHLTFKGSDVKHKWIAIKLQDGSYDGTLYDSKADAVRHQSNEFQCAYVSFRNLMNGSNAREMAIFLQFNRDAYDAGFRLPDPEHQFGGHELVMSTRMHDWYRKQFILPGDFP